MNKSLTLKTVGAAAIAMTLAGGLVAGAMSSASADYPVVTPTPTATQTAPATPTPTPTPTPTTTPAPTPETVAATDGNFPSTVAAGDKIVFVAKTGPKGKVTISIGKSKKKASSKLATAKSKKAKKATATFTAPKPGTYWVKIVTKKAGKPAKVKFHKITITA